MKLGTLKYSWEPYLSYGIKKEYNKEEFIYYQGQKGNGFYYLSKGIIINRFLSKEGKEHYINHISPGMIFGEEGSNGNSYLSTATTIVPSSIYYFSEQTLLNLFEKDPKIVELFISYQIESFRKKIKIIQYLDSNIEKQMKFYLAQYHFDNSSYIPINQTVIANDLETSRMTINKIIRKWKAKGLIDLSNQVLHIINKDLFYKDIK